MRVSNVQLNPSFKRQIQRTFAQALADINNLEEANTFLENFLSDTEYETLAKRLAIAYWLKKGRSYKNIKQNLKVSSATIASVQTMLENPGFQLALKKIGAEEWASVWEKRIRKIIR